jgi:hypothetical protein
MLTRPPRLPEILLVAAGMAAFIVARLVAWLCGY